MEVHWELIIDDNTNTFEVVGTAFSDKFMTDLVVNMQRTGMRVRCDYVKQPYAKEKISISGYKMVEDLYSRLVKEYQEKNTNIK